MKRRKTMELRKKKKTLNDVIPDWLIGNGIMSTLTTKYNVPWQSEYASSLVELDIAYQGAHSGRKIITPFLEYFVNENTEKISDADVEKIAGALWATYRRKWEKLWDLYMMQYDPLHNYDVTTELTEGIQSTGSKTGTVRVDGTDTLNNTDTTTKTGTSSTTENSSDDTSGYYQDSEHKDNIRTLGVNHMDTESKTYGKTETDVKTGTEALQKNTTVTTDMTTTDNGSGTEDNQLFGFNSTTAVDSDASQTSSQNTKSEDGTVTTAGTDTTTYNLNDSKQMGGTDTGSLSHAETGTIEDEATNVLTRDHAQSSITTVNSILTNNLTDETRHTGTVNHEALTTNNLQNRDDADRNMNEHKYGNIGVSSIQRMFREEVENWTWTFMNNVFEDIDALLVLAVY